MFQVDSTPPEWINAYEVAMGGSRSAFLWASDDSGDLSPAGLKRHSLMKEGPAGCAVDIRRARLQSLIGW